MKRMLVVAAAAFLLATPIAIAQSTQAPPPETPPTASAPPPTTQPAPTPAPTVQAPSTTPAPSTAPRAPSPSPMPSATPAPNATPAPTGEPQGCRTRQEAGQQCACLSDTSRIGTSTPNAAGQNICVRPN